MLFCGSHNIKVSEALKYLPQDIFENINGRVAFIMLKSDACVLNSKIRKYEEIIILSPWIFPYKPLVDKKQNRKYKYFIYCILHEVAHIILKHKSPPDCLRQEYEKQEDDARNLASEWFNSHVSESNKIGMLPISIEEITAQQELNQRISEYF